MKPPKIDWRFQITIVVALLGTLTTLAIWLVDRRPSSLTMLIASVTQMAPHVEAGVSGVQVVIDGRQLSKPHLTVIEVMNDGSRPIQAADFEEPILISVKNNANIVRGDFSKSFPDDISPILSNQDGIIKIQPLLLNPGDRITLAVVTENGEPTFKIKSRILNISEIKIIDRSFDDKSTLAVVRRAVTATGLMAGYAVLLMAYLPFGPRVRVGTVAGCILALICCLSAAEVIAPLARQYNLSKAEIILLTTSVVGFFAFFRLRNDRQRRINHRIVMPLDN